MAYICRLLGNYIISSLNLTLSNGGFKAIVVHCHSTYQSKRKFVGSTVSACLSTNTLVVEFPVPIFSYESWPKEPVALLVYIIKLSPLHFLGSMFST